MSTRETVKNYFDKDIVSHKMNVLLDNGVYRHILFKKPENGCQHFEIVTYPGTLVYTGDMGSFVFQITNDMFSFFRTVGDRGDGINPSYWAQKVQAVDRADGLEEFDKNYFKRCVLEYVVQWMRDHRKETNREERKELWRCVIGDVINAEDDHDGASLKIAVSDFYHPLAVGGFGDLSFTFEDFLEGGDFSNYTLSFYWACYAIAYAVKQYDQSKVNK